MMLQLHDDEERTHGYGISYAVSDDFSISYGSSTIDLNLLQINR